MARIRNAAFLGAMAMIAATAVPQTQTGLGNDGYGTITG